MKAGEKRKYEKGYEFKKTTLLCNARFYVGCKCGKCTGGYVRLLRQYDRWICIDG